MRRSRFVAITFALVSNVHAIVTVIDAGGEGAVYARAGLDPNPQVDSFAWTGPNGSGNVAVAVSGEAWSDRVGGPIPYYSGAAAAAQSAMLPGNVFAGSIGCTVYDSDYSHADATAEAYVRMKFEIDQAYAYEARFDLDYFSGRGHIAYAFGSLSRDPSQQPYPIHFFYGDIGDICFLIATAPNPWWEARYEGPWVVFEGTLDPGVYDFRISTHMRTGVALPDELPWDDLKFRLALTPVPDSGSTALLLGLAAVGLWTWRRLFLVTCYC